jgi:hypothetical protein
VVVIRLGGKEKSYTKYLDYLRNVQRVTIIGFGIGFVFAE